ncbi:MAG: nitroreductase family deazaflavin-dependent oxidoreductase [Mycobacteriaceae bacterium]
MNPLAAFARFLGARPWMMKFAPVIPWVERFLAWLTGGRLSLLRVARLPGVRLTVLGRKSGVPRTTYLLCVPYGNGCIVNGSNWGRPHHPAWTANLMAAETAEVVFDGSTLTVRARQITGPERAQLWQELVRVWPGYEMEHRLSGRESRMFLLEPMAADAG